MESSRNKRGYGCSSQEDSDKLSESKRQKLPGLASVIVEAVKVDSLQRLCSSLEPLFRKIVSEEVERALSRIGHSKVTSRSSPPKIQGPDGRVLQLHFRTRMPPHLFTGGKVEGEQGAAIHVVLLDATTGNVVQTGEESAAKLNVVVLEGDFNEEGNEDWTGEHFESFEVKEREGKRPLLTGDVHVVLKEGVGTLGELTFTDNSSWIRSRKFRLGVKVASGYCEGIRVREAKTEAFAVKDHRGELYKKHYPPALHDEVWRLDRIAKDGALHKKLLKANVVTVEDFLRVLVRDSQKLRSILGSGMSNRMWDNTVEHAKTCVLGGKLYVYYTDGSHGTGVIFNHIYEFRGLISDGQFFSLESLNHNQKISADMLVKTAYENWHRVVEYDGKVLNCLPGTKNVTKTQNAVTTKSGVTTQPRQIQQSQVETTNTSLPQQLFEIPFVPPSNQLAALPSNMDYLSMGNSAVSNSYYGGSDWLRAPNGNGMDDIFADEIRVRSSEMLEADDMQRLLKTFGIGMNGMGSGGYGHTEETCYPYSVPYESQVDRSYGQERGKGSGKAVVGWLKLKAALRWGIFIRKKAAERKPQLIELD